MKKILFAAIFAASLGVINAQQISNSDFETWSGNKPTGWNTLELMSMEVGTNSLTKSTESYSGTAALKVSVSAMNSTLKMLLQMTGSVPDSLLDIPIPGIALNGSIDVLSLLTNVSEILNGSGTIDPSALAEFVTGGMTITNGMKPSHIRGYQSISLANTGDMCGVIALVYGMDNGTRTVIGMGTSMGMPGKADYQPFDINITYTNSEIAATELIVMIAAFSTAETASAPYSYILVDDITVDYTTHLMDCNLPNVNIYPNPAQDVIHIDVPVNNTYEIQIFDLLGKMVLTAQNTPKVNIANLQKGVYFVRVLQEGKTKIEKIVIE